MFLEEVVFKRTVRSKGATQRSRKKARKIADVPENDDDEIVRAVREDVDAEIEEEMGLKFSTIEAAWVSSVLDLWKGQIAQNLTKDQKHSRGVVLRELLKDRRANENTRRRCKFVDRTVETLLKVYTMNQFRTVCVASLAQPLHTKQWLRTRLDFLLDHFFCTRSEDRRHMELCDMFTIPLEQEGTQRCSAMVITMSNGKTNKHGALNQMGAMRAKQVSECVIGATALHLFYRFEIAGETFPTFNSNQDWFNIKLMRGKKDARTDITYETMLDWGRRFLKLADIRGAAVLHMPRKRVVQVMELCGVGEDQVSRDSLLMHFSC